MNPMMPNARRPGRPPKQSEPSMVPQSILLASERLFARSGFQNTTLKDVAEASGHNVALVSYYFGGKDGLIRAVIDNQTRRTEERFDSFLHDNLPQGVESLKRLMRFFLSSNQLTEIFFRLNVAAMMEAGEAMKEISQRQLQPIQHRVQDFLRRLLPDANGRQVEHITLMMLAQIASHAQLLFHYRKIADVPEEVSQGVVGAYEELLVEQVPSLVAAQGLRID